MRRKLLGFSSHAVAAIQFSPTWRGSRLSASLQFSHRALAWSACFLRRENEGKLRKAFETAKSWQAPLHKQVECSRTFFFCGHAPLFQAHVMRNAHVLQACVFKFLRELSQAPSQIRCDEMMHARSDNRDEQCSRRQRPRLVEKTLDSWRSASTRGGKTKNKEFDASERIFPGIVCFFCWFL